jgi:hypothetical protein
MLYSALITSLRNQVGDTRRRVHVDWIGDGSLTVFQMPDDTFPVYEVSGTYIVRLAGATKTETTDYTLDKETGVLTMLTAPGNGVALTIDSSAVYLQDSSWLDVINSTIRSLGDDFFKEFVDATLTSTAGMTSMSLVATNPYCIAVYEIQYRQSTSSEWQTLETVTNWRYDRENNTFYVGRSDVFTVTGELLRIRGLKTYVIGTATTDTIDVQDRFLTIIEYGCVARYWRWRYKSVVELVSKMTQEASRTPLQELVMLSDRFDRMYEAEKAKLKPQKPPRTIPRFLEGGGRP